MGKSLNCEAYRDCLEKNFLKTVLNLKDGVACKATPKTGNL